MNENWDAQEPATAEVSSSPARPRGRGMALAAASVVGGLTLGVVGMAAATGTGSQASLRPAAQVAPSAPAPRPMPDGGPWAGKHGPRDGGHGPGGFREFGHGAVHGEFVMKKADGTFQTVQMQEGTATSVSATSITVKSEDGFTRSYTVNKDTLVNAGAEGITSIAVNAKVHLQAIGAGTQAVAAHVMDVAKVMADHDRFDSDREKPTADASSPSA